MKNTLFLRSRASAAIFLSLIALFAVQCKREENVSNLSPSLSSLNVDINYATRIANAYQSTPGNKSARLATAEDSLVVDTRETLTDKNIPIFHILNYKNNKGWIIIGADRRVTPVLAYAHSGKFVLKELPDGPKAWVEGVTAVIQKALVKFNKPEEMIESRWKYIEKTGGISQALPGGRIADSNCSSYDQYMHQCPAGTMYTNLGYPNSIIGSWGDYWTQVNAYAYYMPPNPLVGSDCALCNNKVVDLLHLTGDGF